jgi:hypothetical protein
MVLAPRVAACQCWEATQSAKRVHGHHQQCLRGQQASPPTAMVVRQLCAVIFITHHSLAAVTPAAALPAIRNVLALGRWRLALALQLALAGL